MLYPSITIVIDPIRDPITAFLYSFKLGKGLFHVPFECLHKLRPRCFVRAPFGIPLMLALYK